VPARGKKVDQPAGDLAAQTGRFRSASVGQGKTRAAAGQSSEPRSRGRVGGAELPQPAFDFATGDRTEPNPHAARPNGRQQAFLVVGTQDDRDAGGWLLEHLEERVLGVVVDAMGLLHDYHTRPALCRQECQL
jgi:hypothetical protein